VALVAGIDGCRGGWLAVSWHGPGTPITYTIAPLWRDLELMDHALIAVDMPIGLAELGPRACDIEARRHLLRGRKSSVFPPPRRYMLDCASWAEANALGRTREGKGLSKQTWNITGKIKELDQALQPRDQDRVREVHPELVFHRLAGGPALPAKKRSAGRAARLALLERAGIAGLRDLLAGLRRAEAQADDLIDAAACALAARDILADTRRRVPESDSPRDTRGLKMEIWF